MAVTKKIQIQNASGTGYDSRNIGAEAEYVDVSRDSSGEIITDLDTQTVDSTESLAQTLKNLEDDTAIDSALSTTSTHAVQNKVITGELNKKIPTYTSTPASWDTTPTTSSVKPVTSGGIKSSEDEIRAIVASLENGIDISQDYVIGEYFIRNGVRYKVLVNIVAGTAWTSLSQGIDYIVADTISSEINELLGFENVSLNIFGVKNLLQFDNTTQTIRGITYRVNSDGSVSTSGSVESGYNYSYFYINKFQKLSKGKYILSGCYPNGSSDKWRLYIAINGTNYIDYGDGVEFELAEDTTMATIIRIESGYVSDGMTFYPMIRPASIKDSIYTPYARTNQELTGDADAMLNVLGAKNLLQCNNTTQTVRGITYRVNSDGSVSTSGSVESGYNYSYFHVNESQKLPKGKYILSGCDPNGGIDKWRLYIAINGTNYIDYGGGVEFELAEDAIGDVIIRIESGYVSDGMTFYPMIRPASIKANTYVPYCMTNTQLTERIAIVEGTTPATTTDPNTIVNFPNGFTRDNSMIISIGVYNNNVYRYEDKSYGVSAVMTGDDIQVFARETPGCGKDFKLMLMKIV